MNLEQVSKIYFIGMGGIGMSAAAGLAGEQGFVVLGSDAHTIYPPAKDVLDQHGIEVGVGYSADRIAGSGADLFVVSSGEDQHNPEVAWLLGQNIPYVSFCELLHELAQDKIRVVVSGTHGKSTTAGLLGHIFKNIDDSSFMVGAVLKNYSANFYSGQGHYFIFEGDEYKSTFDDPTPKMHYYKGDVLVLTNLEFDHPDVFANLEEIKQEFQELVARLPDDGIVVYNADDKNLADVVYREGKRAFGFSLHNPSDMQATDITYTDAGAIFTIINKLDPDNTRSERYEISLPGEINVYNALSAIATLRALGFEPELVQQYLLSYTGLKRRFDVLLEGPITIIDDYAHHPTAVRETLEAARMRLGQTQSLELSSFAKASADKGVMSQEVGQDTYKSDIHNSKLITHNSVLWAVYEPHTYSRTRATLGELAKSFGSADQVLLAPMYGARETGTDPGVSNEQVLEAIAEHQPNTRLLKDKQEAVDILKAEAKSGDIIVVMAVGSFNHLAYELSDWLQTNSKSQNANIK